MASLCIPFIDNVRRGYLKGHSSCNNCVSLYAIFCNMYGFDIGEPRRRKKNTVRVHVSTTTEESVKPFQYKKQPDMEFCLGECHVFTGEIITTHYILGIDCNQLQS